MPILDPLALWGVQDISPEETRALIRAAYEMREVLRDAVRHADTRKGPVNQALYNRAAAVIAKTEGFSTHAPTLTTPAETEAPAPFCGIDIPAFLRKHGINEETAA